MYKIKLENTLTHQLYQFECEDNNDGKKLYYQFDINTLDLEDGEYLLTLLDKRDKVVAEDVLKIGDFNPSTLQYKSGDNTYIAISFDAKLGAKNAVISSIESAVYPDDGYDGMTVVNVNAQGVYDSGYDVGNLEGYNSGYTNGKGDGLTEGYTNGYNEGKTDGIVAGKDIQKSLLTTISITENGTYTREDGYNEITVDVPDVNGSYDEGYEAGVVEGTSNAKKNIVENAQILDITENGTYTDTDKLIKEVNVNVVPKINLQQTGLKLGYSTFTEVPEWADWDGITNMTYMFDSCSRLTTIPLINTSKVTNMTYMFYNCKSLITIPLLDTSSVTDMSYMFYNGVLLTTIPQIDTGKVTTMQFMFYGNEKLQSLPLLDCSNLTNIQYYFSYTNIKTLTELGGFKNLKINWNDGSGLNRLPNLTYQSCINILNGLYDFTGNGETPTSSQGKLKVHSNFLTLVGDEISIGTNKGWTITT